MACGIIIAAALVSLIIDETQTQGLSSVGRAPVSKTGCRRFESCSPCHIRVFGGTMANSAAVKAPQKSKGAGIFARMGRFIRESYVETRYKSAWPTLPELRSFTLVVIFAVVVVAAWIATLDAALGWFTSHLGR